MASEQAENTVEEPVAAQPQQKRGGMSALLGGVLAAVLGFVVAQIVPNGWPITADTAVTDALVTADGEIRDVLARKADTESLDALNTHIGDGLARLEAISEASAEQAALLSSLSDRLTALEERPIVDLSSLENSDALNAELAALRAEIASVSEEAQRQIDAARDEATILEQNAADAAAAAARRAALSRVLAALDSGVPFDATLAEFAALAGTDVPAALSDNAAEGVATLASLQASYPDAARDALAAMRQENAGDENTFGNFFRNQFGVRSLEPQEGDSPDAILSRIEGALTEGRLQDAIAEAGTLPASGAEILGPWISSAQARIDAFAAADALTEQQTSN